MSQQENEKNVTDVIQETCELICDKFCIYKDTADENCDCDYTRQGNKCPLDRLY